IALMPPLLGALYHAGLMGAGEPPLLAASMVQLSFALVAFLLFDSREKAYLIPLALGSAALILGIDGLNPLIDADVDATIFRDGPLADATIFSGIVTSFAIIYVLMTQVQKSERQNQRLLDEAATSERRMTAAQQKTEENIRTLEAAQAQERNRQWASEGLAQVATLSRTHAELEAFADGLLSFVVKYLDANQAGFFLAEEDNERLRLVATYAYARKKHQENEFAFGEGLVGQAYLEQAPIYLTELPTDYIKITSGLGEALPSALVIVPLMANERVEGVLEIASFKPFEPFQLDFLDRIGEAVAGHLRYAITNQTTQSLLNLSKQRTEELQAQEEEMRQNMEELAATQEEMARKEQEYLARIAELEHRANAVPSA
ncbi:MAG: GAF domain-containing protein, partial [Catalinimonas sp.]